MAQTTKTPVSILQEMMVRKSMTPEYELIHDGGGTHDNTFTYRVTCDGQFAIGTGRCKKDAKHTAAKNMLDLIATKQNLPQLPSINCGSPVRKPSEPVFHESPTNTFSNAVGELQVCIFSIYLAVQFENFQFLLKNLFLLSGIMRQQRSGVTKVRVASRGRSSTRKNVHLPMHSFYNIQRGRSRKNQTAGKTRSGSKNAEPIEAIRRRERFIFSA